MLMDYSHYMPLPSQEDWVTGHLSLNCHPQERSLTVHVLQPKNMSTRPIWPNSYDQLAKSTTCVTGGNAKAASCPSGRRNAANHPGGMVLMDANGCHYRYQWILNRSKCPWIGYQWITILLQWIIINYYNGLPTGLPTVLMPVDTYDEFH